VTDIDFAFEKQILDISQAERERTYIITASRITSGDELKYLNGLGFDAER